MEGRESTERRESIEGAPAASTTILPARQGVAVPLRAGQRLRIVNTHGGQVVDTWALARPDASEYLSMEHTRTSLGKLMPAAGDHLYSSRRRPLLTLVEDTSPGTHDTLIAACDPERYRLLGADDGHANCAD
ncbi:MAG TPA: urea carboxylase-associated family protein, partial [Solirubrobacteraceae bacterium]|nr:urea carboxylase-associated family protein [Solirubrobacteraceae bacterium]